MKKSEITHKKILDAAESLFMEKGFGSTSTREISQKAGIRQPNLYHYFSNKEEIYVAMFVRYTGKISRHMDELLNNLDQALASNLTNYLNILRREKSLDFNMLRNDIQHRISEEGAKELYKIWQETYLQPLLDILRYSDLEYSSAKDITIIARYFLALITPYISSTSYYQEILKSEDIVDLFINGIK